MPYRLGPQTQVKVQAQVPKQQAAPQKDPGFFSGETLGRSATTLLGSVLQPLLYAASLTPGMGYLRREADAIPGVNELAFGKPQGLPEQILDKTLAIAPQALMGGAAPAQALKSALGSAVGSQVGSELGPLGELVGGIAGGTLANAGRNVLPSRSVAPKVAAKEFTAKEAARRAPIEAAEREIKNYQDQIKQLSEMRAPNYAKAAQLDKGLMGNPAVVRNAISEVNENLPLGISKPDKKLIEHNIKAIEEAINKHGGELPVSVAKNIQKNFNDQIYNRDSSLGFQRQMGKLTNGLNEFIDKAGGPEHAKHWNAAEQAHQQLKKLQRGEKSFIKEKKLEAKNLQSQQQQVEGLEKIAEQVNKSNEGLLNKFGLFGLGSAVGGLTKGLFGGVAGGLIGEALKGGYKLGSREVGIARDAFKNHPEIAGEYKKFLMNAGTKSAKDNIAQLNKLGSKLEKIVKQQESETSRTSSQAKTRYRLGP